MINNYFAVAVVSSDPVAAAEVALGMARAEANHRRAVVGDLVGDLAPLAELVTSDDPHGISDSFLYGISLNTIGREVPGEKNLVVMLGGTEPVFDAEIVANRRWERLAAGFGEVGALLLLVAQHDTPGLAILLHHLNGVVLVKDPELPGRRRRHLCSLVFRSRRASPSSGKRRNRMRRRSPRSPTSGGTYCRGSSRRAFS